jgi:hypothetical protein
VKGAVKHQIPSTNNQIMSKIPIAKVPKKRKFPGDWNLMIGDYLEFGYWDLRI